MARIGVLFDERKAAQAAAYLLHRAGGRLPLLKLMKLLYLAERRSFALHGEPLTGDALVSMPQGPVLSMTYDHCNGALATREGGWDTWISDRQGHDLELRDPSMIRTPEQDLLALSDGDLEVLAAVWGEFGHIDRWALVRYTHDECPEWEDPNGSSRPIDPERLLAVLGYGSEQIAALVGRLQEQ